VTAHLVVLRIDFTRIWKSTIKQRHMRHANNR